MKLSFSDIVDSQAYQNEAGAVSKANIVVATVTAVCIMIFASWGFGGWWLLIIPALWFAASLLVALPFMALRVAAVSALSGSPTKARLASALIDFVNYGLLVAVVYFGLRYLHSVV
jgi:hypothetical protein